MVSLASGLPTSTERTSIVWYHTNKVLGYTVRCMSLNPKHISYGYGAINLFLPFIFSSVNDDNNIYPESLSQRIKHFRVKKSFFTNALDFPSFSLLNTAYVNNILRCRFHQKSRMYQGPLRFWKSIMAF